MIYQIADNVISPLGMTTAENYQALREGRSALRRYASYSGRKEDDYVASRFSEEQRKKLMVGGLTWFESLLYNSITKALEECSIDVGSKETLLVVSTTKANIENLSSENYYNQFPAESVQRVANAIGITTKPLVVCNACISGVAALVTAQRLLNLGSYNTAIVAGCDVINHFVVSGFQSLKAMSPEACRPFDIERIGLNLGEAVATLILSTENLNNAKWQIVNGAIRNDAYHISSPSPKGEGCANAIKYVTENIDLSSIAAVNVHGTATMYNDQMESKAIDAAGLSDVPINTLKGYFGHTLGASGILETVITMHSIENGELLATRGFSEIGVSGKVKISAYPTKVAQQSFVKIISGFGGCNAAILCSRDSARTLRVKDCNYYSEHSIKITPYDVIVDNKQLEVQAEGSELLVDLYKRYVGSYPKFYKMDRLSQLGFLASELLLGQENPRRMQCPDRAIVLFNHSSSCWVDEKYEQSIVLGDDYYPSPSLFVYTLPNIVCGEIALRNGYKAETSFYILGDKDEKMMNNILKSTFLDNALQSIVTGWIDYQDDYNYEADFKIIKKIE